MAVCLRTVRFKIKRLFTNDIVWPRTNKIYDGVEAETIKSYTCCHII